MKTVFITGAAQGIGLAIAKRYASQGWFVGLYDINQSELEKLLSSDDFPNACGQFCDVTQCNSIEEALAHFGEETDGRMDLLVNNAGVLSSGKFHEIDTDAHDAIIDINVKGLTRVAQLAFPALHKTPGATMVNLCSVSSVHGLPLLAVYSASKFYVNGLTEALNIEWAEYDIRVTSVKPPLVNTKMGHSIRPELMVKFSVDMEPEEVAAAVQHAAEGKHTGYILGASTKLWAIVDKFLPEAGRRRVTRYLASY